MENLILSNNLQAFYRVLRAPIRVKPSFRSERSELNNE